MTADPQLKQFATDREWEYIVATEEHGGVNKAAKALGVSHDCVGRALRNVKRKAARRGYAPENGLTHPLPEGLRLKGTSVRYDGDGKTEQYWNKSQLEGQDPDAVQHVPDPKKIVKTATLFDQEGKVTQHWVSERADLQQRELLWRLFMEELKAELPRYEPVALPQGEFADLLACYPVGDHHLGMLAWAKETLSDSYDLKISEAMLVSAIDALVASLPASKHALLPFLGDFMHYDGFEAVTPTNRNLLDADGRYPKMVRAAIRTIRYCITAALKRHEHVHVIMEIGNHDLSSTIFMMEALFAIYENEPRVTIDTSPSQYHYYEFGKVLIGTHHGHSSKLDRLPNIMAGDMPEAWGRTAYRYWWTGHIHTRQAFDMIGCSVESFRILAPVDAWAANKGYRPIRDMKAILMHKDFGEVARHTVNPAMFAT